MNKFLLWILTTGLVPGNIKDLKEEIVRAIALLVQSENYLRLDIQPLTSEIHKFREDVNKNIEALNENTLELKELNNYFKEIKNSSNKPDEIEIEGDEDGNG